MAGKKFKMGDLLNEQSLADLQSCTFEIRPIPLERLMPSEKNIYSIDRIEELAESILDCGGLLEYPRVREADNSNMHEIISGHRRYYACRLLVEQGYDEYKTIPCHIDGCVDPDLVELKLISANAQARVLTQKEIAKQVETLDRLYKKLKSRGVPIKGRIRNKIAKEMDVSPAQVSRYESINKNLISGLKKEFDAGRLNVTDAYDLSTLPPEEQAQALDTFKATGELPNAKKEARKKAKGVISTDTPGGAQITKGVHIVDTPPIAPKIEREEQNQPVAADMPEQRAAAQTGVQGAGDGTGTRQERIVVCPCCGEEFTLTD